MKITPETGGPAWLRTIQPWGLAGHCTRNKIHNSNKSFPPKSQKIFLSACENSLLGIGRLDVRIAVIITSQEKGRKKKTGTYFWKGSNIYSSPLIIWILEHVCCTAYRGVTYTLVSFRPKLPSRFPKKKNCQAVKVRRFLSPMLV